MKTAVIYSNELEKYSFGEGHPFTGDRFADFFKLYKVKLGSNRNFELVINNEPAADRELELWHTENYIKAVKAASKGLKIDFQKYMSRDNINPVTGFPKGIENASRIIVRNSILAVDYVQQSKSDKTVNIGGGLHHAKPSYGEGFCIYNDVVIALRHAVGEYGLKKILVIDTDAHAGNGTCEAFYSSPEVLFIDIHQRDIYPGTGYAGQTGSGRGKGYTVNLPLYGGTGDRAYELIFDRVVIPLAVEYEPQMVVRYGGSDPHFEDGLTGLGLTLSGFKMIGEKVREISKLCGDKSVDLICSGYNRDILPGAWLSLIGAPGNIGVNAEENERFGGGMLDETNDLIREVKENLKPYWKSMR